MQNDQFLFCLCAHVILLWQTHHSAGLFRWRAGGGENDAPLFSLAPSQHVYYDFDYPTFSQLSSGCQAAPFLLPPGFIAASPQSSSIVRQSITIIMMVWTNRAYVRRGEGQQQACRLELTTTHKPSNQLVSQPGQQAEDKFTPCFCRPCWPTDRPWTIHPYGHVCECECVHVSVGFSVLIWCVKFMGFLPKHYHNLVPEIGLFMTLLHSGDPVPRYLVGRPSCDATLWW